MKRDQIVAVFFFGLLAFVLWQIFRILSPFFGAIFWSTIIAFGCFPLHRWIRKSPRTSENVAALLTTTLILLVVLPIAFLILLTLASQAVEGYEKARAWVDEGGLQRVQESLRSYELFRQIEERMEASGSFEDPAQWDVGQTLGVLKSAGGFLAVRIGSLTGNLFILIVNLALMVVLLFFFFRDGEKICRFLVRVIPMEPKNKELVVGKIRDTFEAVIRGQFITTFVQGMLAWIIYSILGIPLALFFGFLTALAAMIPAVGAALVWVPLTIGLVAYGSYVKAGILFVTGAGVISLVDNFLKPFLIGGKTRIPYLLLLLGILGGIQVYGLTGIFLAPLLLSLMFVLIQLYREKYPDLTS